MIDEKNKLNLDDDIKNILSKSDFNLLEFKKALKIIGTWSLSYPEPQFYFQHYASLQLSSIHH